MSPLVYAVLGVVATLVIVAGLGLAYLMGQRGSEREVARGDAAQGELAENSPPAPQASAPQSSAPGPLVTPTTATASQAFPPTVENPVAAPPALGDQPIPTQDLGQDRSPSSSLPPDDPRLPTGEAAPINQPLGATPFGGSPAGNNAAGMPLIVRVPVPVAAPPRKLPAANPDLVINFAPDPRPQGSDKTLVVDHLSTPGITGKYLLWPDRKPKSEVKLKITPPNGLKVDPTEVTFPANTAGVKQAITITGDGSSLTSGDTWQTVNLRFAVTGGGLKASDSQGPPVRVLRRNSFRLDNGWTVIRGDAATPPTGTNSWVATDPNKLLQNFNLTHEQSTSEYVQLLGSAPSVRVRLYDRKIEIQIPADPSPTAMTVTHLRQGAWQ